jgi:hypothetical protein
LRLQVARLLGGELENEIIGKPVAVATHLLVQAARLHAVERREVGVEHHAQPAHQHDAAGNGFERDRFGAHADLTSAVPLYLPFCRPAIV